MGDTNSSKSFFTTLPGIITAVAILVTAIAGLLTVLKPSEVSDPTPIATAPEPPTEMVTVIPTPTKDVTVTAVEPSPTSESATPTSGPVDTPTPTPDPNLLLVYDEIAVNVINVSKFNLSLVGVTFRRLLADESTTPGFEASDWDDADVRALRPGNCLQVLVPVDKYERPEACKSAQDFKSVGNQDLHFWIGTANSSKFKVFRDDEVIEGGECTIQDGVCEIYLPEP